MQRFIDFGSKRYTWRAARLIPSAFFAGILATAALNDGNDAVAASGTVTAGPGSVVGVAVLHDGTDLLLALANAPARGNATLSDATDTATASGSAPAAGVAVFSDATDSASAAGIVAIVGSAVLLDGADAAVAAGSAPAQGIISLADGNDSINASGSVVTIDVPDGRRVVLLMPLRRQAELHSGRRAAIVPQIRSGRLA